MSKGMFERVGDVLDFLDDPLDERGERKAKGEEKKATKAKGERAMVLVFMRNPARANWTAAALADAIERGEHTK